MTEKVLIWTLSHNQMKIIYFPIFQAKRQQRKLNFLITQTELYAHFMARKITGETESTKDRILRQLDEAEREKSLKDKATGAHLIDTVQDNYGELDK